MQLGAARPTEKFGAWPSRTTARRVALVGVMATLLFVASTPTGQAAKPEPTPPRSFDVSGLTSAAAGTAQTVKVTALLAGKANPAYRGTVVLSSTDAQAVLPARYTFTQSDKGVHSFLVTLKTVGSQTVTATDAASSAITGSQTVTVPSGPAKTFALSSLANVTAGAAQSVTLTVRDAFGNVANAYRGTVHFTSSDSQAGLPANHTFTAGDAGSHTFSATLKTAGSQSVTVTDTATATLTATSTTATIAPASAASLTLGGLGNAVAGAGQSVAVTARDQYGNVAKGYTGTVAFSSNDVQATLPSNHTFTGSDAGSRSFNVALKTAGQHQSVTVTDQANASLSASQDAAISSGAAVGLDMTTDLTGTFGGDPVATAGAPFQVFLRAIDAYDNTATGYTGTVRLTSSDDLTPLPGGAVKSGTVQFGAADSGSITLPGVAFFTKRIYEQHASLTAVDTANAQVTDALDFQVLPGPAVRYSACPQPRAFRHGNYEEDNGPIGVNDQIGLPFTALDAYENDATVVRRFFGESLFGYEALATVTTSDDQAEKGPMRFTGSTGVFLNAGMLTLSLRTAGAQTVTITDPNHPSLTRTCSYTVHGPKAYTGTITVADPRTTGDATIWLPAVSYLPPHDSGVTVGDISGPNVDNPNGGLSPLGAIEGTQVGTVGGINGFVSIIWNLDPASPAPGTVTCDTTAPCQVTGPLQITYTLEDDYGNSSAGTITVNPFHAVLPPGNVNIGGGQVIFGGSIPFEIPVVGTVVATNTGTATVQIPNGTLSLVTPSTGGLVIGGLVTVRLGQTPLDVDSTAEACTPAPGVVCYPAGWLSVSVTPGNTATPSEGSTLPTGPALTTVVADGCGVITGGDKECPRIGFNLFEPADGGSGYPPKGFTGLPYKRCTTSCVPYKFLADSTYQGGESGTFSATGDIPPGLEVKASGEVSGIPTRAGLYTFRVTATGATSGATKDGLFTIWIIDSPVVITTQSDDLSAATEGEAYSHTLVAAGGSSPYSWSVVDGQLPSGLELEQSSGKIVGTPTTPGPYSFTVRVHDADGDADTETYSMTIN